MSLETILARGEARDADRAYQQHRKACHVCQPAARKRQWDRLCADGRELRDAKLATAIAADMEARLDKEAATASMEPLF